MNSPGTSYWNFTAINLTFSFGFELNETFMAPLKQSIPFLANIKWNAIAVISMLNAVSEF